MNTLTEHIGKKIKAYRNLNKPEFFSVKDKSVLGYARTITLSAVTFTGGNTKAQADIQAGAHRSVHAYACGVLVEAYENQYPHAVADLVARGYVEVTYTPKLRAGFYIKSSGVTICQADMVILADSKMFALNPR